MEKLETFWHNLFRKKDKKSSGADESKEEGKVVKDGVKSEVKGAAKIVTSDENKENIVNEKKATNDAIDNQGREHFSFAKIQNHNTNMRIRTIKRQNLIK